MPKSVTKKSFFEKKNTTFIKTEEGNPSIRAIHMKGIDSSLEEIVRGYKGNIKLKLVAVGNSTI